MSSSTATAIINRRLPILPPGRVGKDKRKGPHSTDSAVVTQYGQKSILLTVSNFFSQEECQAFILWGQSCGFTECDEPPTRDTAHRKQGRLGYDDIDNFISNAVFSRVSPFLPPSIDGSSPVACSRNIRMYRYRPGDSFGRHIDESNRDPESSSNSKLTLLIYLNGGCKDASEVTPGEEGIVEGAPALEGGETKFFKALTSPEPIVSIVPVAGTLLLHGHGHRCMVHEAAPVLSGCKYVLRTDVMYR